MSTTGGSLVSRALLALRAGLQFGGSRDLYAVLGYDRTITADKMYEKYKRQDVATSVIDKPAEALWTNPPKIVLGNPKDPDTKDILDDFARKHDLWAKILRADKILGMEPYVVLYLGMSGRPDTPVTGKKGVEFIQVFGASSAGIASKIANTSDPRFGYPEFYNLSTGEEMVSSKFKVHHSRVIHLTNELLDHNILSQPRMVKGYNILEDILKIAGSSAETYWLTANRGMQVDVDKDMDLKPDDLSALSDEIDEYQHQLRRVLRTRGVKVNSLGSDMADPRGVFAVSIALLSSTYKIPQRILMGAEAGQLASEQDRANWAVSIQERRISFAQPYIMNPVLRRLMDLGVVKGEISKVDYVWPEAFKLSPLERAQTMAQTARAVVNLSRQTQLGHPIITTEECREVVGFSGDGGLPSVEEAMEYMKESKATSNPDNGDGEDGNDDDNKGDNPSGKDDKKDATDTDKVGQ